jgi:hypothetical protein
MRAEVKAASPRVLPRYASGGDCVILRTSWVDDAGGRSFLGIQEHQQIDIIHETSFS